jgi:ubiquinone/menaquinone biosynthesis C-methylase UbiE
MLRRRLPKTGGESTTISFNHVADLYDETRRIPDSVLQKFYADIFKKLRLKQTSVVLDAGVGTGRTIDPLLEAGVQLVGIDISPKMLQKLTEKIEGKNISTQVHLILGDVTNLPFGVSCFDLILAIHILPLVNWKRAILEAKRVLKPKGFFIAGHPGVAFLQSIVWRKYTELADKYIDLPKGWRCFFWKQSLKKLEAVCKKAYEIGFSRHLLEKVRGFFRHLLEKRALRKTESMETFLKNKASFMETKMIKWKETLEVGKVFERLKNRPFSPQCAILPIVSHWVIPIETHKKIMCELRTWINKEMGNTHFLEELERKFEIAMVQF